MNSCNISTFDYIVLVLKMLVTRSIYYLAHEEFWKEREFKILKFTLK